MLRRQLLTGLLVTISLIVLTCGVYPLAVWGVGQVAFRHQANGSFVSVGSKAVGSALIGQSFSDKDGNPLPQYFQPRPSAAGAGYDSTQREHPTWEATPTWPVHPRPQHRRRGRHSSAANPYRTPADPYCVPVGDHEVHRPGRPRPTPPASRSTKRRPTAPTSATRTRSPNG